MSLNKKTRELITQLNNLSNLSEQEQSHETTMLKANIFFELAKLSSQPGEKNHFISQCIALIEAVNLDLIEKENLYTQDKKDYIELQVKLANAYMLLAHIKNDKKIYNLAKKILKPLVKESNINVLITLIVCCANNDEPALCRFYIRKLINQTDYNPNELTHLDALKKYENTTWFLELFN